MRILAHVHTFNAAGIIDRTIEALLRQTRPLDGIIVVDNASTDGTVDRPSLKNATILRHHENAGTSGAVVTGLQFALEQGYDWMWILDADSVPEPDALERLLDLFASLPRGVQDKTAFLASLARDLSSGTQFHGQVLIREGLEVVTPSPGQRHYRCDLTIWSGCLFSLEAVRRIGLPNADYVLDWGDFEFTYRAMSAGYKGFIDQESKLNHNVRGASLVPFEIRVGPLRRKFYDYAPIRCYYKCRNMLYFALYDVAERRSGLVRQVAWRVFKMTLNFLLRPLNRRAEIAACLRGIWHGLTGNVEARF
jgi:GT2 family glycosyltransferase